MTATEAINTIKELLGFRTEKFMITKLVDETEITNGNDDAFQVGDELFIVEDSILKPAPAGRHETREGLILETGEDSVIMKIEQVEKEEDSTVETAVDNIEDERVDMMSKATLTDGTVIETDETGDFQVGQKLFVITQEGDRVQAPEGEHTTESGIVLTVDAEGFITGVKYPDEAGEGSLEDMKKMKEAMSNMIALLEKMENFKSDFETFKKEFETFKKQPDRTPVLNKFNKQSDVLDNKLELIRNSYKRK
jgi:ribosomal protein L21E